MSDHVTAEEILAFTDEHARKFQLGKYRPKSKPEPSIDLRDRPDPELPTTHAGEWAGGRE